MYRKAYNLNSLRNKNYLHKNILTDNWTDAAPSDTKPPTVLKIFIGVCEKISNRSTTVSQYNYH